jgi:RNA 2',3'-cyclic 3'-phosphodiesterase
VRCFVALDLPTPVLNHLSKVTAPLRERYDIRWVPRDQMHMTLLFGGDMHPEDADQLLAIVEALEVPPITLALNGFGTFPPKGLPHVVWAGLDGDVEIVRDLQVALTEQAEPLGVQREKRGFTPHVTLGRVQGQFGLLALLDQMKKLADELNAKPFAATALTMYRSTLTPKGPFYEVMLRRELA